MENKSCYKKKRRISRFSDTFTIKEELKLKKTMKKTNTSRPFRLSEPFTLLIKRQLMALTVETPADFSESLFRLTRKFWTNYLAITGELGPTPWNIAYDRIVIELDAVVDDYCSTESPSNVFQFTVDGRDDGELKTRKAPTCLTNAQQIDPIAFCFAGWSHCSNLDEGYNQDDLDCSNVFLSSLKNTETETNEKTNLLNQSSEKPDFWESLILNKMRSKKQIFWRGRLHTEGRTCFLMEHNLALLFLAALEISSCFPDHLQKHGLLTLQRLQELCKEPQFPYITASRLIKDSPFDCCESIFKLFCRDKPPQLSILTSITLRMSQMLALTEFPMLPLGWLVHRSLQQLGLPDTIHRMANRLIGVLERAVAKKTANKNDAKLRRLLPRSRYFRSDVFAMALTIILVRLVFKLNDDFEYCWDRIARAMNASGQKQGMFVWTEWISWMNVQYHNRSRSFAPLHCGNDFATISSCSSAREFLGVPSASEEMSRSADDGGMGWSQLKSNYKVGIFNIDEIAFIINSTLDDVVSSQKPDDDEAGVLQTTLKRTDDHFQRTGDHCWLCSQAVETSLFDKEAFAPNSPFYSTSCDLEFDHSENNNKFADSFISKYCSQPIQETLREDLEYLYSFRHNYESISVMDFSLVRRNGNDLDSVDLPKPVSNYLSSHERQVAELLDNTTTKCIQEDEKKEKKKEKRKKYLYNKGRRLLQPAHQSLVWLMNTARLACGASMKELISEIFCLEQLIEIVPKKDLCYCHIIRPVPRNVDLALAVHFDYSICI